ncbi:hypothetical protein PA01_11635 [Azoarcus sp. PA01]|nr:hypothetical protein PA01_11635 [Azoarcus sp. PA01]
MKIPLSDTPAPLFCTLPRSLRSRVPVLLAALAYIGTPDAAFAQTPYASGPLQDIVLKMPEGSWRRVNANNFSDVWTPASLRPLYGLSNPTPYKIIAAWSSFAWDTNRGDLILYGGGHANYSGNDVYRWRSRTLKWERAALPSQIKYIGSSAYMAIDGTDAAPASAHTYDNAEFLPIFDRYLNFGGAIFNSGGAYVRRSEKDPTVLRKTGPYLFNPALSHPMKVGGTTGSHVKRVAPYPEVVGGNMWENRDLHWYLAGQALPSSHVNGCTAYSYESPDYDVVYVGARSGSSTALHLYRYQFTRLGAPWLDKVAKVGAYWSSPTGKTTCAHDPVANIVLRTGSNTSPFFFWDLRTASASNREKRVSVSGSVATFVNSLNAAGINLNNCGMDYNWAHENFAIWCGAGNIWIVEPPEPLSTTGWKVTRQPVPSSVPPRTVGTGILGKWKYVEGFDVFVGVENSTLGNVWIYKPITP